MTIDIESILSEATVPRTWFDKLAPEEQDQLRELRQRVESMSNGPSVSQIHRRLSEQLGDRICGKTQFLAWWAGR
ncbi:hypothetical protein [Rubinisphaera brasiliensis]|uniref:Chromosome segregation ATPase-like protein n=1 Tax=Rubinisphaera brasiliensis (strain ATCC 49424 / DSM 5305 / JCM 21570 / IAM 15109 / NBRC 103401 / IFAM 1448) TaxID=756272 RepID=F0SPG5_RUBBR|nr:hypothetical protein [Rubinisphaera brasiliensis]ADY57869.1 chromosome segregation ATPase-like protein [Rubinisphaera brasiliensis DSM 5305]